MSPKTFSAKQAKRAKHAKQAKQAKKAKQAKQAMQAKDAKDLLQRRCPELADILMHDHWLPQCSPNRRPYQKDQCFNIAFVFFVFASGA